MRELEIEVWVQDTYAGANLVAVVHSLKVKTHVVHGLDVLLWTDDVAARDLRRCAAVDELAAVRRRHVARGRLKRRPSARPNTWETVTIRIWRHIGGLLEQERTQAERDMKTKFVRDCGNTGPEENPTPAVKKEGTQRDGEIMGELKA
ncbi:hypothetical protein Scep_012664 [Stephania cephalantha]|uniref:Uncharacterized protein n=1 Tax=Stephania cephalantha TaxID=152367 RepID=A0AAP0PA24_9MAGN